MPGVKLLACSDGVSWPGNGNGSIFLPRSHSWISDVNVVMAGPSPTDPVEKSTTGKSFVTEGYDWGRVGGAGRSDWDVDERVVGTHMIVR